MRMQLGLVEESRCAEEHLIMTGEILIALARVKAVRAPVQLAIRSTENLMKTEDVCDSMRDKDQTHMTLDKLNQCMLSS